MTCALGNNGKQLENTVFLELLRRRTGGESITFFQGRGECDFVIGDEENVRKLVQVVWTLNSDDVSVRNTRKREIDGLVEAAEALSCDDLTIVTHDESASISARGHRIRVIPAWKWCLEAY